MRVKSGTRDPRAQRKIIQPSRGRHEKILHRGPESKGEWPTGHREVKDKFPSGPMNECRRKPTTEGPECQREWPTGHPSEGQLCLGTLERNAKKIGKGGPRTQRNIIISRAPRTGFVRAGCVEVGELRCPGFRHDRLLLSHRGRC